MNCSMPGFPVLHYLLDFAENSYPLGRWCHPTILSSVALLLLPSIFPNIRVFSSESSFPIRWPSIGALPTVLPMNIQDWVSLELTGLISLLSEGCSRFFSKTTVQKHKFFSVQPSLWSYSHIHIWLLGKKNSIDCMDLWWKCDVSAF